VSHLAVLALLAVTVVVGVGATANGGAVQGDRLGFPFNLIAVARGADAASFDPQTARFELAPQPDEDPHTYFSGPLRDPEPTPLPTPVAPPVVAVRHLLVKPAPIVGTGQLIWPVANGSVTQYYSSYHQALDIAAPAGTAVLASADGVVTWAGWKNNGGGYQVWISHGSGLYTTYNHMSAITVSSPTS